MPRYTAEMAEATTATAGGTAGDTYAMPATQGQMRFWSLDQLKPGNPALNMPLMWKFSGPLDMALLSHAFALCVERHETLRTTFALLDGQLSQIIHPAQPVSIPVEELMQATEEAQWSEADRLARSHAAFEFDLARGPLLELRMLCFHERSHLLLVTMHHIVCDGISNGILLRDLAAFYEALVQEKQASLPELPIQFADFAVWQKDWLEGEDAARSLDFWRKSLGNDFERIHLTRDEDALATMPERLGAWTGNIETLLIPQQMQARAHAFCVRENVTLNILLFTIFVAMLHRLTGQDDLTIGSPCANRTEDTSELIGLFMNIQVMRLRLTEGIDFRALLGKVQEWTLGAYENQELPFETLVHDSFFSTVNQSFEIPVFFLYQKSFMLTHRIGDLGIVPLRSESPGAVFEIMFAIVDRAEEGPRLQLEYNPRSFKVATIHRYLAMFVELLDSALAQPNVRVDEMRVLPAAERELLLTEWNRTAVDFGTFEPASTSFLRRTRQHPERTAIECNGTSWSYGKLAAFSQRLAGTLMEAGVRSGDLVAIAMERSPAMVAAVLAVMMSGGAYVPLDRRHPRKRLEQTLADCAARWLLVSDELGLATSATIVKVSPDEPGPVCDSATAAFSQLAAGPAPEDLAYVIYTSGSTGVPKGVAVEHGALVNLLRSMQREPGICEEDVVIAVTTLAFDIAALEVLLPLMTGARLVLATEAEVQDGRQLLARIDSAGATVLQATPGAWRLLLDAGWTEPKHTGRSTAEQAGQRRLKALCGGETLPRELAEKLLARAGEVWNMYGPTETTIWSSATLVAHGEGPLRIGPPIANTQFYVLDRHLGLAPISVVGELYIGGAGIARGYWNRPELTRQKFVANPFGPGRLYATGDLARRRDNGTIELLGRSDFQVKVRGYRIELAEIEAVLGEHPRVKESVVIQQRWEATGVTRLAAYVATDTGSNVGAVDETNALIAELKTRLQQSLPDFMLPNAFVIVPALPRNANGKIDRRALPPVESGRESGVHSTAAEAEHYYPPTDAIERQLADIWQTTLAMPRVSVRASFFSLGVGSLAALRLITKMNRVFGMDLGLASLISASTIQSIAELIRMKFAPNTSSSVVPLQPEGARTPLFVLHGVGGNVVNFYGLAMRMGKEQPVYGIQSQALLSKQPALLRLKDMAAHYLADIRKVQPHGPYRLLGYSFGGTVVLEMAHQLRAAGEEVALLGMIDSKSRDYAETFAHMKSVHARINDRVTRFRGNTGALSLAERLRYVGEKLSTRAIRFACMAAARLHFHQVPAFMRSAYDINYVAVQNYKPRPYDGRLVLFRASEQDRKDAPYDLGWSPLFTHPVEIHELPGDHERIFLEPNIDSLAESLTVCLVQA